jgi:hypothetical protein
MRVLGLLQNIKPQIPRLMDRVCRVIERDGDEVVEMLWFDLDMNKSDKHGESPQ